MISCLNLFEQFLLNFPPFLSREDNGKSGCLTAPKIFGLTGALSDSFQVRLLRGNGDNQLFSLKNVHLIEGKYEDRQNIYIADMGIKYKQNTQ